MEKNFVFFPCVLIIMDRTHVPCMRLFHSMANDHEASIGLE